MFRHPSINLLLISLAALLLNCEHNERDTIERLVLNVQAGYTNQQITEFITVPPTSQQNSYKISASGMAFVDFDSIAPADDSPLTPTYLLITINQVQDLVPSLLRALGNKVTTRFEFDESSISVNHTNVADSLYVAPGDSLGDTLYIAVRGEGLISDGQAMFENVTGFFHEQSTYQIFRDSVSHITCRYELTLEY